MARKPKAKVKMKTKRSAHKRVRVVGNGKVKHRQANRSHHIKLGRKTSKRIRQLRATKLVNPSDVAAVRQMLPYS